MICLSPCPKNLSLMMPAITKSIHIAIAEVIHPFYDLKLFRNTLDSMYLFCNLYYNFHIFLHCIECRMQKSNTFADIRMNDEIPLEGKEEDKDEGDFYDPEFELFVWAVLQNDKDMATLFLGLSKVV